MQKLLQISAGVFLWIAASGAGHRVCASKRRTKGLRGAKRKPRRRCSEGKEKFRLRVCGEPSANRAGAAAREKKNFGFGFAHQNGEQRVCGEPSANRAGAAAREKENPGTGFAHQNGEQRDCGEPSANRAGKKKPPPFVSEWGKRRRHIRIIQFWVPRKTVAEANVFLWGVKR